MNFQCPLLLVYLIYYLQGPAVVEKYGAFLENLEHSMYSICLISMHMKFLFSSKMEEELNSRKVKPFSKLFLDYLNVKFLGEKI
jgi:hypothetical protein